MKQLEVIDADIVGEPKAAPVEPEPIARCRITLKGGEVMDLDKSVTRIKHIKRTGGYLPMKGPNGNMIIVPAKFIKKIEALAPAES